MPLATLDIDVADLWKSYLPLALALHKKRQAHAAAQAAAGTDEAFVVGLNAPPGCGKSTLVQLLRTLLRAAAANDDDGRQGSLVVAHVGSDDLYMTQSQRREAGIPSRLDARSIDGSLADSVLWALKRSTAESEVAIPRFNKGLDEREDPKLWTVQVRRASAAATATATAASSSSATTATSTSDSPPPPTPPPPHRLHHRLPLQRGKVDVVLFEGWRVGVNHPAYARFNEAIDLLVCLDADEEAIKEWKVQSSRRDAVVAGKPFDEAAVRRAFDELIMPFVTVGGYGLEHRQQLPALSHFSPRCSLRRSTRSHYSRALTSCSRSRRLMPYSASTAPWFKSSKRSLTAPSSRAASAAATATLSLPLPPTAAAAAAAPSSWR